MVLNQTVAVLEKAFTILNPTINRIVLALIILFLGFIIGRITGKLLLRALREVELDARVKAGLRMHVPLERIIANLVQYGIYSVSVVFALDQLTVLSFVLYMVLGAIFIALIMSFLLSIKDFLPNAMAGVRIKRKRLFRQGDHIRVRGLEGEVRKLNLLDTQIQTRQGDTVFIPNSSFASWELEVRRRQEARPEAKR